MFEKIDRELMQLMHRFQESVGDFHAFRKLWAAKVANRESCGVDEGALEQHQGRSLQEVLNIAEQIRRHTGLKWMTVLRDEAGDGLYFGEQKDGPLTAIELENGKASINGEPVGTVRDLINSGWRIDGPFRSAVLR